VDILETRLNDLEKEESQRRTEAGSLGALGLSLKPQKYRSALAGLKELSKSIYVCSFSENGDQLSQWRGYCRGGAGYSIGFNYTKLQQIIMAVVRPTNFITLKKCIYAEEVQKQSIDQIIRLVKQGEFKQDDVQKLSKDLMAPTVLLAPFYKNRSFVEEAEWRLICYFVEPERLQFREGKHADHTILRNRPSGC